MRNPAALFLASFALFTTSSRADDAIPAGHSVHGQAFNEGPRQKATLRSGMGPITLEVTTTSDEARRFVLQGFAQLHGFWYFEAERSFRQAAKLAPACAFAYLGMAMANRENQARAPAFIAKADALSGKASSFEQAWIAVYKKYIDTPTVAVHERLGALMDGLEKIGEAYPDDLESRAFLALEQWTSKGKVQTASDEEIDGLIQHVLDKEPKHPCLHYRIHLWDYVDAAKALDASARCGQAAPGIAHMWHMPAHIYSRLFRYDDAVWQQEASARVDHAYMIQDRVMPDQIFNYAHNNEWLIGNLINVGRVHDALDLAKNMIELPRHPRYNTLTRGGSSLNGRRRLFEVLELYEMWEEIVELSDGHYLEPTPHPIEQVRRHRARALALMMRRKFPQAKKEAKELLAKRPALEIAIAAEEKRLKELKASDNPNATDDPKAVCEQIAANKQLLDMVDSTAIELECYLLLADGKAQDAADKLDQAKTMPLERKARFWIDAGNTKKALELATQATKDHNGRVQPLANLVDILVRIGELELAVKHFKLLRERSAAIDLDTPVFRRLEPLARKLGLGRDWRVKPTTKTDVGTRPALDTLGPFRWSPYKAPAFALSDDHGKTQALEQLAGGKPIIVVFFLGHRCKHCVEQLKAFAPATAAFAKRGIRLVAISTETPAELSAALATAPATFPILADPDKATFKAYNAYDDFEDAPLHGAFLLDGKLRVRWQDIHFEPFADTAFLLDEAERLLGQKIAD